MTNVRSYTTEELLEIARSTNGFKGFPQGYWLLFVRSTEDAFDTYDDKAYLFKGEEFVLVTSCTTNKGKNGTAVIKSNQWMYDGFRNGLHKGKMECLRQNKPFYFYRDVNGDQKTNETGEVFYQNIYTNFHGSTYTKGAKTTSPKIGGWSEGCIVCNVNEEYEKIINLTRSHGVVSGCLVKER